MSDEAPATLPPAPAPPPGLSSDERRALGLTASGERLLVVEREDALTRKAGVVARILEALFGRAALNWPRAAVLCLVVASATYLIGPALGQSPGSVAELRAAADAATAAAADCAARLAKVEDAVGRLARVEVQGEASAVTLRRLEERMDRMLEAQAQFGRELRRRIPPTP